MEISVAELLGELLERCRRGEQDAVRILVERFGPAAQALATVLLQDRHLAEDAVQAALVTALTRLGQLQQPEAFVAWLRQIVRSECHRILRRRHERSGEIVERLSPADASPEESLQRQELQDSVRRALAQVVGVGRQTAELFYLEERPLTEVARILQVPEGTVKRRLHDVRAQLRDILLGHFAEPRQEPRPDEQRLP